MKRSDLFWFAAGVFLLALAVGLLTGLTATSVVTILIPLLFALLTAGGALYVIRARDKDEEEISLAEQGRRARFLGQQLLIFSFGFLIGLWLGVAGKVHSNLVWLIPTATAVTPTATAVPAYTVLEFVDLRLVPIVIDFDRQMTASGLSYAMRVKKFQELNEAIQNRIYTSSYAGESISYLDAAALEVLLSQYLLFQTPTPPPPQNRPEYTPSRPPTILPGIPN